MKNLLKNCSSQTNTIEGWIVKGSLDGESFPGGREREREQEEVGTSCLVKTTCKELWKIVERYVPVIISKRASVQFY